MNTSLSQCHAWLSAEWQTHRNGVYWVGRREVSRQGGGRQGARKEGEWEGGSKGGWGNEGGNKRREGGNEAGRGMDATSRWRRRGNKGREVGREGERWEQGEGGSDDASSQRSSVAEGRVERGSVDEGNERWRDGAREQWRETLRDVSSGRHWPVYSIFTNHPTTRPLPSIHCYYKWKIVNRYKR